MLSMASQLIVIIIGLAYTPIMLHILGDSEYGLYQLVQSVVNYLNLMNFGFNGAYIRYYTLARESVDDSSVPNINGMFMDIFLIIALLCFIAGMILLGNIHILGTHLTESDYVIARKLLLILVLNLSLSFPNSLFVAYISANERFIFLKGVNLFINILMPLINIPILYLGYGSVGVVSATLCLTILRLIFNGVYSFKKLSMTINLRYFDKTVFKSLLGYTFFIFLSDVVDQLNTNVDKFLLGRMIGTVAVTLYSIGFNLKTYYVTFSWVVPEMYIPEANRLAIEEKNDIKLTSIFTETGRINNYLVLLIFTGFVIFGRQFITLWLGNGYEVSYYAAIILMASAYIPAIQTLGVNIQNAKNLHKVRSIVYFIVACLNVVGSVFLIRKWGVIGTCLGTLFAAIPGYGLFMNYYYKKHVGLDIIVFWKKIIRWTVASLIICTAGYWIVKKVVFSGWIMLGAGIAVYTLFYLMILWFVELDSNDKSRIKYLIKTMGRHGN